MFLFQTTYGNQPTQAQKKDEVSRLTSEYYVATQKVMKGLWTIGGKAPTQAQKEEEMRRLTSEYYVATQKVMKGFWTEKSASPASIPSVGTQTESTIANSVIMLKDNFKKYFLIRKAKKAEDLPQDIRALMAKNGYTLDQVKAAAESARGLAGAYMNMVIDPLNTAQVGLFKQKADEYQALADNAFKEKGGGAAIKIANYRIGEQLFIKAFGFEDAAMKGRVDYSKAKRFADQMLTVQLHVAQLDNSAPFINFENIENLRKLDKDSAPWQKAYNTLSSMEKNYYDACLTLQDPKIENGYDFSNRQVYEYVSSAYLGRGMSTPYSGADLISVNEDIMRGDAYKNARAEFEKTFGSGLRPITSMNLRAQYDFFMKTAPEMKRNGLWTLDGIGVINDAIVKLDPFLGFSTFASSVSTKEAFSLQAFNADVTVGSITTLTLSDNTTVSGILVKNADGSLTIGGMTITGNTFTISGSSTVHSISEIVSFTKPLTVPVTPTVSTVGYGNIPDFSAMTALPSPKLDGFFFYAMPVLVKNYQPADIGTMMSVISESQNSIITMWTLNNQNTTSISDVTSARAALRSFNEKLATLLVASTAKQAAINEVKAEPYFSNFRTLTIREREFRDLAAAAIQNQLTIDPFIDIHYDGLEYYFDPDIGPRVQRGNIESVRRLFSDIGLQMVVDPPSLNIHISKYSNGMRAAVVQQITDATTGFGPNEAPVLYLNAAYASLVTRQNESKLGNVIQDRGYYYGGTFSGYYGRNTFYNGDVEVTGDRNGYTGHFGASAYNSPFIGSTILQEGRLSGDISGNNANKVALERIENYMRFLTPEKNNVAIYISKNNADGTYSARVAYRTKENGFRTLTVVENLTDSQVRVMLQHFEINNPYFGPTLTAKFDSYKVDGAKIGDPLSSQNFAGMMFATNFGKNVAMAAFDDPDPESPRLRQLGESIRSSLINDMGMNIPYQQYRIYQEDYTHRQALSTFFNLTEKKGLYAEVFNTQKGTPNAPSGSTAPADTKASPDEFGVRYIVDEKLSLSGSIDRINPGSRFDAYSFDGKAYIGNTKVQVTSAMGVASALGSYYSLPTTLTVPGQNELIGGTSVGINSDKIADDNTVLRRYAYLNLLYKTNGTLWSQLNGPETVNRTIGARYDNLLGWAHTTLKVADQENRMPGFQRSGYAGLFSDESRKMIKADWDAQAAGGTVGYVGVPYNIYGLNVRNLKLSNSVDLSFGAVGGTYTLHYASGAKTEALGGAGMRLRWNRPLAQTTFLLQGTVEQNGGFGGAAGVGVESTKKSSTRASSYTVASYRQEDFFKYRHWNAYNINRVNNFGTWLVYDFQSMDLAASRNLILPTTIPVLEQKQKTQLAGALFYQTTDNMWRVYTQLSSLNEKFAVSPDRQYTTFSLGASYNHIPGKSKKFLYLNNATLQLDYNGNALGTGAAKYSTKNFGGQITLYFSPGY
ncbi:MAG: hypothetical protein NTX79_08840 [Candidatus Micrarchaeota archaeon]|nr:hypothetical protein [Candidatus Micrarchaeota archaeon]